MKNIVEFSLRPSKHLEDLYLAIARDSGAARADALVSSIVNHCLGFDLFPERGARRDDLSPGLRIIGYRRYLSIAFRVEGDRVVIFGIYYGGRNFEADFEDPST